MAHSVTKLIKENQGVTAIEFAAIAPVVIMMIMGIIEFSLVMFASTVMETATGSSSRYGKTGYTADGSSRQDQMLAKITARSQGVLDASKLSISTLVYDSFANIGQQEPYIDDNNNHNYDIGESYTDSNGNGQWDLDMGIAGLGDGGDIVLYTISYPWDILTPTGKMFLGDSITLETRTVVKNEPY